MEKLLRWVSEQTGSDVVAVTSLRGGWTSEMRRVRLADGREVVVRSFVTEFFRRHAEGLLEREAGMLRALTDVEGVPAPRLLAVDATAQSGEAPSLVMSLLPGSVDVQADRSPQLAEQLVAIHRVRIDPRPREFQVWVSPSTVRVPEATNRPEVWTRAVELIGRELPPYDGVLLHRDFHPGNVLFDGERVTGVVDWVETSWGPADLDVAHCSTALALLHGPEVGARFADLYVAAGGRVSTDLRHWRVLDALGFAPDAEKVAGPWRELGRTDLTPGVLRDRLERYLLQVL
ncbi:phosphotransferase [Kribbella italica]|uniref:Aminoglycoside phosphotransferase (APT) family kinase protein n=1 Tax=Kribbella italica TaxID=1540520 RepID=A0A7W9MYD9_9ACTN|nr:aminoglycoside phosphotransferase (APT) family kinase protein [Kribbella italica]